MRDRARSLAIGIALTPLTVLGLIAVFTHGTVEVVLASIGFGLSALAVIGIYVLERTQPRPSARRQARAASTARRERSPERAVALDVGVRWDRDRPNARLIQRDGDAALILQPCADDKDRRLVVLFWTACAGVRVGPPDAETRFDHRLYTRGLRGCEWAAEVRRSTWVAEVAHIKPELRDLRHFVILTKEETVEVVAPTMVVRRVDRIGFAAASADETPRP